MFDAYSSLSKYVCYLLELTFCTSLHPNANIPVYFCIHPQSSNTYNWTQNIFSQQDTQNSFAYFELINAPLFIWQ